MKLNVCSRDELAANALERLLRRVSVRLALSGEEQAAIRHAAAVLRNRDAAAKDAVRPHLEPTP